MTSRILAAVAALAFAGPATAQIAANGAMIPTPQGILAGPGVAGALEQTVNRSGGFVTSPVGSANLAPGAAAGNLGFTPLAPANNLADVGSVPATLVNLSAIPHVATLAALKAWPASAGAAIRDGYASPGDGGAGVTYFWSSSACPLNSGAGDNGWQVQAAGGGCWTASLPTSGADIRIWGAVPSTIASPSPFDSSAAIVSAVRAASAGQAGGVVVIPPSYFLAAQSGDLDLRSYHGVTIKCTGGGSVGVQPTSNLTAPCTLQLNPAYTILPGPNFEMTGVRVVNENVEVATTVRAAVAAVNAFAGNGIVITQNDAYIHDVQINGFNQAIQTIAPYNYKGAHVGSKQMFQVRLDDVMGDDISFMTMGDCGDSCHVTRLDAWNFITNQAGASNYTITNVSAYTNGAVEVGVALEGVPLVSGDMIEVYGISDTGQPKGRYTVGTIVDPTHFTLAGTTFSGSYTAPPTGITATTNGTRTVSVSSTAGIVVGQSVSAQDIAFGTTVTAVGTGNITISSAASGSGHTNEALTVGNGAISMPTGIRKGTAFEFTGTGIGGQYAASLWEYGHDVSVHVGPAHGPINIDHLWIDGSPYLTDATPVGIWHEGFGVHVFGGVLLNKATTIKNTSTDSWQRPLTISGSEIHASGCQAGTGDGSAINITAGAVVVDSSLISPACPSSTYPGYNEISMSPGTSLKIATTNTNGATIGYPAAPAWATGTSYTATSYVTGSDGGMFLAGGTCTSAGSTAPSGSTFNDGGCTWTLQPPTCLSATVDGVSPSCTPPATTTPCTAGQLAWDNASLYVCSPNNTWGSAVTGDVTTGQVSIIPPASTTKSALVVKSNDGATHGGGGQITLGDNGSGSTNALKFLRVSYGGHFQILNYGSTGIFDLDNEGNLGNVVGLTSPWGFNLSAAGAAVSAWATGQAYTNSTYATSSGNIYHVIGGACTSGGTSGSVAPSGTGIVTDGTGGTGSAAACTWEYVSGVLSGNIELHAKSTGAVTVCAGNTATQKGLLVQNGALYPALCDGSGLATSGVALGSTASPFSSLTLASYTIAAGATQIPACSSSNKGTLAMVTDFTGTRAYAGALGAGGGSTATLAFCTGAAWEQR